MLRAAWRVCENEILASTVRRVYIVTSSLSYAQLDQTLAGLRAGETPEPHFVQLYVGSSRVDLQACKLEYSIVSPK